MNIAVWCALGMSVVLPLLARSLSSRCAPALAAVTLTALSVAAAVSLVVSTLLLGLTTTLPDQAVLGSDGHRDPVPRLLAVTALVVSVLLVVRAVRTGAHEVARLLRVDRHLDGHTVVLVDADHAEAFAVQGLRRSRIEVTRGLLDQLDADERRAVLAHERAHLRGKHAWLSAVVRVCAAVHPGLASAPRQLHDCCERWADESAARSCGRRPVARALGLAALAVLSGPPGSPGSLAFSCSDVPARVEALIADRPALQPARPLLAAGLVAFMAACALHAVVDCLRLWGH